MGKKKGKLQTIVPSEIEHAIHTVRGSRIMLDADLAKLYGVTTAALNQAVKRNPDRFPDDFAFQLTQQEFSDLISQNVISKSTLHDEQIKAITQVLQQMFDKPEPPQRRIGFHSHVESTGD